MDGAEYRHTLQSLSIDLTQKQFFTIANYLSCDNESARKINFHATPLLFRVRYPALCFSCSSDLVLGNRPTNCVAGIWLGEHTFLFRTPRGKTKPSLKNDPHRSLEEDQAPSYRRDF